MVFEQIPKLNAGAILGSIPEGGASCPLLSYIDSIESQTQRTVTIATVATPAQFSKCLKQEQSPLFSKIPGELRSLVFEFATAPSLELAHQYKTTDYYYRPEHPGKWKTSTTLLRTCRRIWLETYHLPLRQAEHVFFFDDYQHRPPWAAAECSHEGQRIRHFLNLLTPVNVQNLEHVHIFAQMHWLERSLEYCPLLNLPSFCPRVLTITIRYMDWWGWEGTHEPLLLNDEWIQTLLDHHELPRLEELRIELETIEPKADQMRLIAARVARLEPNTRQPVQGIEDSRPRLWVLQASPPERTWSGPAALGNERHRTGVYGHNRSLTDLQEKTLNYRIVTQIWRSIKVEEYQPTPSEAELLQSLGDLPFSEYLGDVSCLFGSGENLKEHALTMPWRARWTERWEKEGSLLSFADSWVESTLGGQYSGRYARDAYMQDSPYEGEDGDSDMGYGIFD